MKAFFKPCTLMSAIILLFGCGKNTPHKGGPGAAAGTSFFANTEWTGVAKTYGQTYPQPFYLHFNGDTTVSVYALFAWVVGNDVVWHDSTIGKITSIETAANGQTSIAVNYPLSNDQQVYIIDDKKMMTGGSVSSTQAAASAQYTVTLQINPAVIPSIDGTSWNTDIMTGGPTNNMPEFPDINGIHFTGNNKMTYTRGGKIITYTPPTQDQLLIEGYQQHGPRIYFAGYNETSDLILQYFGVLAADGKTILADSRTRQYARLPNYLQTIYWYGQPGVTPVTHLAD